MHHRSPLRQLIASVTLSAFFLGTWAPLAAAQNTQTPGRLPAAPSRAAPGPVAQNPQTVETEGEASPSLSDEERREQAREAFEAAQAAFQEEDYQSSYDQFRRAHTLAPSPHAEYWMALSLDRMEGRDADAARAYRAFLANPAAPYVGDDKIAEAQARLNELKVKLPARVTVTSEPAGAQISVDDVPQPGTTPLTLELAPGTYRIVATLPDHRAVETKWTLEGGTELDQHLTLERAPKPPPVEETPVPLAVEPEPTERSLVPAYVTLGLAGAGLVTGTLFGLKALSDRRAYNENPTVARADSVERSALLSDMAFGIAITLGITGIVLLTSSESDMEQTAKAKKKAEKPQFAVAPIVAPNLGGAAAHLTF